MAENGTYDLHRTAGAGRHRRDRQGTGPSAQWHGPCVHRSLNLAAYLRRSGRFQWSGVMLTFLVGAFIGGLVIGALARLVVPGPNPIGFWWTVLCGVGGSLIGGSIGHALFRSWFFVFGLEVLAAAVLVAFVTKRRRNWARRS
jgi:uncharacterized membrane protein YeaQ/YmgE (transglycosylase-associated protein family)